jgi:hypothetical protein
MAMASTGEGLRLSIAHFHTRCGKKKGMCMLTKSLESQDRLLSPPPRINDLLVEQTDATG